MARRGLRPSAHHVVGITAGLLLYWRYGALRTNNFITIFFTKLFLNKPMYTEQALSARIDKACLELNALNACYINMD